MLLNAMGAHSIALEMMDAMQKSSHYTRSCFGGWTWTALLVIPHSAAVNFAYPKLIGRNGKATEVLLLRVCQHVCRTYCRKHERSALCVVVTFHDMP